MLGEHVHGWQPLIARSPQEHERRGVQVRLHTEVVAIDLARREVHWRRRHAGDPDPSAEGRDGFDALVIATGAGAFRPSLPGLELGHPLYTPWQARRLGAALQGVQHAVIAGGGYIGLEMAENLRRRGMDVELITRAPQVMRRTLDEDIAIEVQRAVESEGVAVRCNTELTGISAHGDRLIAHTSDGESATDVVVLGLGSRPRAALAAEAGVPLGATGAIAVDHAQRTAIDGVYAAGDCAEAWHRVMDRWVNFHLGTIANKAGRVAGLNVAGAAERFPGVVGTAISRICDTEVARTGLSSREAAQIGLPVRSRTVATSTRAGYMPESGSMHTKLLTEARTGRVVGGQIVGADGAAKRIDTLATAISAGLTARDLVDLDLGYAPPFSPVWDPVQTAGRQLV